MTNWDYKFIGIVEQFPGYGGWFYIAIPKKYTKALKQQRMAWGMFPITASVGQSVWSTKLMMKKGGNFFIAFKADIRKKENITTGNRIKVQFRLEMNKKYD